MDIYNLRYTDKIIVIPMKKGYIIKMSFGVREYPKILCAELEDE
jgi:hypothetical protein